MEVGGELQWIKRDFVERCSSVSLLYKWSFNKVGGEEVEKDFLFYSIVSLVFWGFSDDGERREPLLRICDWCCTCCAWR